MIALCFRWLRAAAFLAVSYMTCVFSVSMLMIRAQSVENEHRLTSVETKLDAVMADLAAIKRQQQYDLVGLLGIAGLSGEAGIRLLNKRRSRYDE